MKPVGATDGWQRVEELFASALERDPSDRQNFIDAACDGDPGLRREVVSLLAAHERTGALDRLAASIAPLTSHLRDHSSSLAGRTIGRYRVLEQVAGGGMGIVYKAVDERLGRTVALKFLHPSLAADATGAERFRREARAIASLEHPNICTLYEIAETDDGQLYLSMPLYEGETLQQRIARGQLSVSESVAIAVQLARGLAKAHGHGIVHRDIKPSNVLLTVDGVAKILDFGIARLADATITDAASGPLGTLAYMSPEHLRSSRVDGRTDLWSLGVVLYEMLAGERPFSGGAAAMVACIQHAEPVPLSTYRTDIPRGLDRAVARALSKSPDARYQSAEELESDLVSLSPAVHGAGNAEPGAASAAQVKKRVPLLRSRMVGGAAVALALIAMVAVLWMALLR